MHSSSFTLLYRLWESSQNLENVFRWSEYYEDGIDKGMKKQSVLSHEHTFSVFAGTAARLLNPYVFKKTGKHLDLLLLETSFKFHDHGEGLLGRDIIAPKKTSQDDLKEYLSFMEHIGDFPSFIKKEYEYAFLLQFALENPFCFPNDARCLMEDINSFHFFEALTFRALEKFEYLIFPMKNEKKHKYLLTWVIRKQLHMFKEFSEELPGFRDVLFTVEVEEMLLQYLKKNENVPELIFS